MRLRASLPSAFALAGALFAGACKDESPISHAPTHIVVVSGTNQSGNVSSPLDSALVVQVLDGANKAVANVPLTWTAIGGGSLSATSTTSDANGKSTVNWTLAPTAGTQVVTVTSGQITGASVSFVASNGATISGTVTGNGASSFGATFSRSARGANFSAAASARAQRLPTGDRIVVGFKSGALGVAALSADRSITNARATATRMKAQATTLMQTQPIANPEASPSLLATRFRVTDAAHIDDVMAALRNDPSVDYVERDGFVTVRDGAPRPMADLSVPSLSDRAPAVNGVNTKLPNDPNFWEQTWTANMLDLPKAWAITTGSSNVVVAVVDMGIRFEHPDVAANLTKDGYDFVSQLAYTTAQPLCGGGTFTTIDGDGDGPDADPTDPDDLEYDDTQGCWAHNTLGDHGLWTAGIIGAVGNDNVGATGVAWNVRIRPIRVLGITGAGSNFDIAQGILYAAGLPATGAGGATVQTTRAPIINLSLGGPGTSATVRAAVAQAIDGGSLVVASAGNDGLDLFTYPAAYPNVLSVAAVGMDGGLATYSNAGTFVAVSAPGGDFRLDDNGGGGVYGPGWNFATGAVRRDVHLFGYGTSASAPFVSGIAALMLAQNPSLTNTQLKSRIEQYSTRPSGLSRSDTYGWGIVNAYNAMTQQTGPTRATIVRLVDATTGTLGRTAKADANGSFVFTKVASGTYYLQAGDDEGGDGVIGSPGRRFAWAGTAAKPTPFAINGNSATAAIVIGIPMEVEPNDDAAHANVLSVNSYVAGTITTPDFKDVYSVTIPTAGVYTFETSGLVGGCGLGIELDTYLSLASSTGTVLGTSGDAGLASGPFCSRISQTLQPGTYYITVSGPIAGGINDHGRYRLEVRSGS